MDELKLRDRVQKAIDGGLLETARAWEDHERTCRPLVEQMADAGLFALQLGVGEEARNYSSTLCVIREMFGYASPLLDISFALQGLGTGAIVAMGSDDVRKRYLTDLVEGRKLFAFALSEPHSASDVLSMRLSARRDGEDWILNGQKMFVSGAPDADVYVVFARTDGKERGSGITAFVIDKGTPGFEVTGGLELSAPHAMGYTNLVDCRIPDSQRIGGVGEGLRAALGTLETYRPSVGAYGVGMGLRAVDLAIEFASDRYTFGTRLVDHAVVRVMIGRSTARMMAGRALFRQAAGLADAAEPSALIASAAKLYGTEMATKAIYDSQQIHGGRGVLIGYEIEELARNIRGTTIYEGTSEIQRRIIGRLERKRAAEGTPSSTSAEGVLRWARTTYEKWLSWLSSSTSAMSSDAVVDRVARVCVSLLAAEALALSAEGDELLELSAQATADEAAQELIDAMLATVSVEVTTSADPWAMGTVMAEWAATAGQRRSGTDELYERVAALRIESGTSR